MGRTYELIDDRLREWLERQPVFFVATAPLSPDGHVNCSPKSNRDELAVLGGREVAYLDRTGSGVETIAHLQENGRIVLMFCAFDGPPRIVRLHGRGRVAFRDEAGFDELAPRFRQESLLGSRAIVTVEVRRIADSCGYAVPLMDFREHRHQADDWHSRKGEHGIRQYWAEKNAESLDELPGLPLAVPEQEPAPVPAAGSLRS